jgi:predicted O-methyltransferase YrrM
MVTIPNEVIFSVLRILQRINPGDLYYNNYLYHLQKYKESFFDIYHLIWSIAIEYKPKTILEIGTRTGLSLCQLLSAYIDYSNIQTIISCDLFNDGFITPSLVKLNLKSLNIPQFIIDKIEFLVGDSRVLIPDYEKTHNIKFDYVLVDGSHEKVDARLDLENVRNMIAPKGFLLFDDIGPDGMNLDDVWQEFKLCYKDEFEWFENYQGKGTAWAIKKD